MHITIFNIIETRVVTYISIKVSGASDYIRYESDGIIAPRGDEFKPSGVWCEMIGVGRGDPERKFTIWTIKGENKPLTLYKNGICVNNH